MEISRLDDEFIEKKMKQSAKSQDITSWSNFQLGWKSAIRFVKKVEKAAHVCTQCGKLIRFYDTPNAREVVRTFACHADRVNLRARSS